MYNAELIYLCKTYLYTPTASGHCMPAFKEDRTVSTCVKVHLKTMQNSIQNVYAFQYKKVNIEK